MAFAWNLVPTRFAEPETPAAADLAEPFGDFALRRAERIDRHAPRQSRPEQPRGNPVRSLGAGHQHGAHAQRRQHRRRRSARRGHAHQRPRKPRRQPPGLVRPGGDDHRRDPDPAVAQRVDHRLGRTALKAARRQHKHRVLGRPRPARKPFPQRLHALTNGSTVSRKVAIAVAARVEAGVSETAKLRSRAASCTGR